MKKILSNKNTILMAFLVIIILPALVVAGPPCVTVSSGTVIADPTDPPYCLMIYDATNTNVTSITVEQNEPFWLYGSALGNVPLTYDWYLGTDLVCGGCFELGYFEDFSIPVPGVYEITLAVTDVYDQTSYEYLTVTVTPAPQTTGDICGQVILDNGDPVAGVAVSAVDVANEPAGDVQVTGADGLFTFTALDVGSYSVSVMTPLGFAVAPSETQTGIAADNPCTLVDFVLTPITPASDCRSMGYWKHQFSVYLTGRGSAQETAADLELYLDRVYEHFEVLGIFQGLSDYSFPNALEILTVRGGRQMESRARQQLFALLLNFASGRIGNATVVSDDDRDAADAVTLVAILIGDGDALNDVMAKDICETINRGESVAGCIIPASSWVYKPGNQPNLPDELELSQNFPNPFNPVTQISIYLPNSADVKLEIFNITGQKITTLVDKAFGAGYHSFEWDASKQASGIYIYRLTAGGIIETKKMVLLK